MSEFANAALPDMALTPEISSILSTLGPSMGNVATAFSLPAVCYTSEAWFDFERRAIFDREWIAVGHHSNIPEPGDYVSIEILGEPLLVVRGEDRTVRVMSAVCRHRGHILGEASGNAHSFTCPFHGWTYDLAGQLTSAPEMNGTLSFAELKKTGCLPRLRTEVWNGFIFVNFDGEAAPLAPRLKGLTALVANHGMSELASVPTVDWPGNAWNWKFMQENALEPYHTHYLHAGIHDFAPSKNVRFKDWDETDDGAVYREVGFTHMDGGFNVANKALFPPIPTLTEAERSRVVFAGVMPNLFFGAQSDVVFYYLILPQSAANITLRVGVLTTYDNLELPTAGFLLKGTFEGLSLYNDQDTVANTKTARGMRSRLAPRTRWAPTEQTLAQLNTWLIKRYQAYAESLQPRVRAAE